MEQMTRGQALAELGYWARNMRNRDPLVIAASFAGLTKVEISKTMGIARSTVDDILRKHRERAGSE